DATGLIHFHRKPHGRIDRADTALFQLDHDRCADIVNLLAGAMKFEVCHRARRPAYRFARHANNKAQKRPGPGVVSEDLITLSIKTRAREFDQPAVVRSAIQGQVTQPGTIQLLGSHSLSLACRGNAANRRMLVQLHGGPSSVGLWALPAK